MAEKKAVPTRSGAARLRKRRTSLVPSAVKTRSLFVAVLVVFLVGTGLSTQGRDFLSHLYSPIVIVILLFLAIEYIALKGRDRSRIYRIELDHARRKRQEDLEFFRRLEDELLLMQKTLEEFLEKSRSADHLSELERMRARLAELRRDLSDKL